MVHRMDGSPTGLASFSSTAALRSALPNTSSYWSLPTQMRPMNTSVPFSWTSLMCLSGQPPTTFNCFPLGPSFSAVRNSSSNPSASSFACDNIARLSSRQKGIGMVWKQCATLMSPKRVRRCSSSPSRGGGDDNVLMRCRKAQGRFTCCGTDIPRRQPAFRHYRCRQRR